jgi:hypothetical protein
MNKNYWLALACALCAYLVRTQGLLLIVSIIIYLCLRKEWKPAVIVSFVSLPFVAWLGIGGRYGEILLLKVQYDVSAGRVGFADMVARTTDNMVNYCFYVLPQALLPMSAWAGLSVIVGIVLIILIYKGIRAAH